MLEEQAERMLQRQVVIYGGLFVHRVRRNPRGVRPGIRRGPYTKKLRIEARLARRNESEATEPVVARLDELQKGNGPNRSQVPVVPRLKYSHEWCIADTQPTEYFHGKHKIKCLGEENRGKPR
jgi:hypothetical protein